MQKEILSSVDQACQVIHFLKQPACLNFIETAAQMVSTAFAQGSKIIIAGNGGSLCDAMHFAEELTGVFRHYRPALPAIALCEPGHLTCVGNDLGFEKIFSRGVEAYGKPGDIFIGLTTSGKSANIVQAFETAKKLKLHTVSFLGKDGGLLKGVADLELCIENFDTSDRIQEAHMAAIHIIIECVEYQLFPQVANLHSLTR